MTKYNVNFFHKYLSYIRYTFYPLDHDEDKSQQCNHNLTLRTTLIYLNNHLDEDFFFFF